MSDRYDSLQCEAAAYARANAAEAEIERLRGMLKDADERASRIEDRVADLNRYGGAGPGFGGICQRHDGRYVLLEDVLAVARALQSGEGGKG